MSSNSNPSSSREVSHYVVTAHPSGSVLRTAQCNFLTPDSLDVLVAKSSRLEVRQLRAASDTTSVDSFPILLNAPLNGRLTALLPLTIPSLPTSAVFLLQDRLQYAVISHSSTPNAIGGGTAGGYSPYPVVTHASGSLSNTNNNNIGMDVGMSGLSETGTISAVDPHCRCIVLHVFDGLLTIFPIDRSYTPPNQNSNAKDDGTGAPKPPPQQQQRGGNPRRPKQMLGTPFHCRIEEKTILSLTFLHTSSPTSDATSASQSPPVLQLAVLHQDSRGAQHVTSHVVNLEKQQLHLYGSQSVAAPVQWLKKSAVDGGSSMLLPVRPSMSTVAAVATTDTATTTIPTPNTDSSIIAPGVVVIGQRQFTYCSATTTKIVPVPQALFLAYAELPVDPATGMPRFLLGDEFGNLHMLSILTVQDRVVAMQLETLGSCALATSLAYLGEGLVFVGSTLGDSQLVQIHDDPIPAAAASGALTTTSAEAATPDDGTEQGVDTTMDVLMDTTYLTILEEYTNLGPILDFDLVPTTPGGKHAMPHKDASTSSSPVAAVTQSSSSSSPMVQSQVVTASGSSKSGSLRVIRNGIGMNEYAAVDIPGIQAMWSLRKSFPDAEDTYLVQSFVGETRVLGVVAAPEDTAMAAQDGSNPSASDDEEEGGGTLEEVVLPGLLSSASTLYAGNLQASNRLLQITESEVRLTAWSGELISNWTGQITVAAANEAGQIAVALQGGLLVYLSIIDDAVTKMNEKQMDREVSCININPFASNDIIDSGSADAMDVEPTSLVTRRACTSSMVAVGLWDDFTVRLLSTVNSLDELLCISLSTDEEVEESFGSSQSRRNRNNMMARSVSLITLDFSPSSGYTGNAAGTTGVNMLFVGLGDGTLISFAVTNNNGAVSVQSKKEVCLGTQRIDLVPLSTEQGGSCVLATGDRPTVVYLAGIGGTSASQFNPKLCYSSVNVSGGEEEEMDDISRPKSQQNIAVNIASPFFSSLLFDTTSLGNQCYSLCVADDTSLRLGVIDDIQKLHVTTCRLGMAPRRIVHCPEGRLFAVGCIESGIQNLCLSGDESNMGNCIRFMDDSTFDDLESIQMDPFEMILSMTYATLEVPQTDACTTHESTTPSKSVYRPFLLVGTAYALPDEDEPSRGRVLVYSCEADDDGGTGHGNRAVRQITEFPTEGGVYSMSQFYDGKFLMTVNTRTHISQLTDDAGLFKLEYVGLGHFGHILSLFVKSRADPCGPEQLNQSSAQDGRNLESSSSNRNLAKDKQGAPKELLAIVGDLMRSISLVQYYPEHKTLEEIARDFNENWTTAIEMLSDSIYLGAENWNNLFCVRRNTASSMEEQRCRLDTVGEFHLGEMCNKFMSGSLVMPVSSSSNNSSRLNARRTGSPQKKKRESPKKAGAGGSRVRRPLVVTGSQTLYGTVDGTLGVILGLDGSTTSFFSTLERALAKVISHVGDFSHQHHRACHVKRRMNPAHGFVDGDLVEGFLDLDRRTMEAVVDEMNRDGGWDQNDESFSSTRKAQKDAMVDQDDSSTAAVEEESDRPELVVDDVLAMVEEMAMLH